MTEWSAAGAGAHPTDSSANRSHDKGCNKYREGKYDEAGDLFKKQVEDAQILIPQRRGKTPIAKFLKTTPMHWFPSWIFITVGMLFLSVRTSRMDPSHWKSQMYVVGALFYRWHPKRFTGSSIL